MMNEGLGKGGKDEADDERHTMMILTGVWYLIGRYQQAVLRHITYVTFPCPRLLFYS